MNALIPFQFENKEIRVVRDENGEPLFVGKDICVALGYVDPTTAIRSHCRGVLKLHPISDSLGRTQEARVLSEPDVLRLIVNCKLPAAQAFERLVFEEILPSIRKTGTYSAPVALSDAERFLQSAQLFVAMEHRAVKMEQAQVALSARLDAVVEAAALNECPANAERREDDESKRRTNEPVPSTSKRSLTTATLFGWNAK